MGFDRTYLSKGFQLCHTCDGHILAGGCHRPKDFMSPNEDKLILKREGGESQFRTSEMQKANELESILIWEVTRPAGFSLETAAYPCSSAASRHREFEENCPRPSNRRGQFETLHRIGTVLANSPSIRCFVCDGHGSHEMVKRKMLGQQTDDIPMFLEEQIPFFSGIVYRDLPEVAFPLPFRAAAYDGDEIFWFPGPQHLAKNLTEQLRSVLRTIYYGNKFVDFSGCLECGLPPTSYIGCDTMSDWQSAMMKLGCDSNEKTYAYCFVVFGFAVTFFLFKTICSRLVGILPFESFRSIFILNLAYNPARKSQASLEDVTDEFRPGPNGKGHSGSVAIGGCICDVPARGACNRCDVAQQSQSPLSLGIGLHGCPGKKSHTGASQVLCGRRDVFFCLFFVG